MTNLSRVLRRWRINEGRDMRDVAREVGISAATWCRLEQGERSLDARTFVRLLVWLMDGVRDDRRGQKEADNGN